MADKARVSSGETGEHAMRELSAALNALRSGETPSSIDEEEEIESTQILDPKQQQELMNLRAQQSKKLSGHDKHIVVMFTDLVGSTQYYERYGDMKGREKVLTHNALLFPIVQQHGGVIVKTIGDAIMGYFGNATDALRASSRMQHALASHNQSISQQDEQIHIRIALNAGVAIAQEGDIYGDVVNVAARIEHQAQADEILMSATVSEPVNKAWPIESAGSASFKGKAEPVALFRLRWKEVVAQDPRQKSALLPDHFDIRKQLARGSAGDLFLVYNRKTGKETVVKRLYDFLAEDPNARAMFVKAAGEQMKLEMDGALRVLSHSEAEQAPAFCETEVLDAMSLSKLVMKKGKPKTEEAVGILQRVCAIVAQAQEKGVIHCDLEPDNIMVRPDGRIVINNFGLAHLSAVQVKKGANAIGSPAFIAPEALLGNTVTTRSDTYSLGALLYYLLSGKEPIEDATSLEGTMVAAQGAVVPLKRVCPTAPDALVSIVGRSMGVLPRLRFENARVFNEELQKISTSRAESNYLRHSVAPPPPAVVVQPALAAAAAATPPPAPATQPLGAAVAQIREEQAAEGSEQLWTKPPVLAALALVVLLLGLLSGILLGRNRDATRAQAVSAEATPVAAPPLVATRKLVVDKDSALRKQLEAAKLVQLGDAFVVVENDKVAVEWAATPAAPVIDLGRLSAHVSAFALGKLIDTGKVKSLSAPVYETFPEWEQGSKRLVTLRHILEHSTGLRAPTPDDAMTPPSALQFALAAEMQSEPGTKHSFNARAFNLLSGIVAKTSDRQLDELFNAEVAAPLGLSSPSWTRDPKGMPLASSGLGWTAMDLAQLGVAFIDGGKTPAGRLFSEAWILAASTPSVADDNVSMLFRRHEVDGVGTLFFAADTRGSFWLVAPARKLVAVRLLRTETTEPAAQLPALVNTLFNVKVDAKTLGIDQPKSIVKK